MFVKKTEIWAEIVRKAKTIKKKQVLLSKTDASFSLGRGSPLK